MMAIENYKFVSPTVEFREVFQGRPRRDATEVGPVVIGRFRKGPGMVPTVVRDLKELEQVFGGPEAGVGSRTNDFWRERFPQAPMYASYAAYAYLQNAGPLTVINVKGTANNVTTSAGFAGYPKSDNDLSPDPTVASNAGAYGLFLIDSASLDGTVYGATGQLAAVWYLNSGSSIRLAGDEIGGTTDVTSEDSGSYHWFLGAEGKEFTAIIKQTGVTQTAITSSFNFDESSPKFIRKVFNTNPVKTNDALVDTSKSTNYLRYYLGETFEDVVARNIVSSSAGKVYGCIVALAQGSKNYANYRHTARSGRTGWVISQHVGDPANFNKRTNSQKLFRLVELNTGEYATRNLKVSIANVRYSKNTNNQYGLFDVEIRDISDTDASKSIVESFVNCTLDPNSNSYIGKKIGTKYKEWDFNRQEWVEYGEYENVSKFFRVEIDPTVDASLTSPSLVPFGFFSAPRAAGFSSNQGASAGTGAIVTGSSFTGLATAAPHSAFGAIAQVNNSTASYVMPEAPLVDYASDSPANDVRDAYFGVAFNKSGSTEYYKGFVDYTKVSPTGLDIDDEENQSIFTLDEIRQQGVGSTPRYNAFFQEGSYTEVTTNNQSISRRGPVSPLPIGNTGHKAVIDAGFNNFTMPVFGGFDGFDIAEREPLNHRSGGGALESGVDETTSAAYSSLKIAIDSIADPEVIDLNVASMPGIKNVGLTDRLIDVCEDRRDVLAIIDLEGDYTPITEGTAAVLPNIETVLSNVDTRNFNSTYAAAYYPWCAAQDPRTGNKVWLPPSVPALGTLAYTERVGELWFAPAGFNRGGLSRRAAGINITDVSRVTKKRDRDRLQDVGVNPIAKLGRDIVIYGQKTLSAEIIDTNRINVRRMMIYLKKTLANIAKETLFEGNVQATWDTFLSRVDPVLKNLKSTLGIEDYKLVLDESTTTEALKDQNIMYAIIAVKPVKSIEYIALDFALLDDRAAFND